MMLTLKIIGLAFEAHRSFSLIQNTDEKPQNEEQIFEDSRYNFNLTFMDIFYYIFNYCGVLTGEIFLKLTIMFSIQYATDERLF